MSDEILKKTITISGVEDTGTQVKIKDENGKRYSFFKTKKDGGETKAFEQFKQYKVGDTTGINYKEVPYKDGTIKNLLGFAPSGIENARPVKEVYPNGTYDVKNKQTYHKEEEQSQPQNGKTWDDIAVGKCQTNFLEAFIRAGHTFSEAKLQITQARQLAELVVYGTQQEEKPFIDEPLPTETGEPEYAVDTADIPF